MTKTLNQFIEEGYLKVKSSDEQKFIDKHVAVQNPDRNGNGDEVFKGAKVKTINRRKERKGYDAGDDAKVYEEAELEEKAPPGAKYERMVKDIKKGYAKDGLTNKEKAISYATAWKAKKANEEAELAEMEKDPKTPAFDPARSGPGGKGKMISKKRASSTSSNLFNKIMDKHSKYSKANEEAEQIDELKDKTLQSYADKSFKAADRAITAKRTADNESDREKARRTAEKRSKGLDMATQKRLVGMRKEESEQIDELKRETVRSYYNKAIAQGKPIADRMKMGGGDWSSDGSDTKTLKKRAAGVTMALKRREGKVKMSEETLVDILSGLKESHIRTMVEVYESLSEENQAKFVATCKKDGGIDAMLNFAIKNRGE